MCDAHASKSIWQGKGLVACTDILLSMEYKQLASMSECCANTSRWFANHKLMLSVQEPVYKQCEGHRCPSDIHVRHTLHHSNDNPSSDWDSLRGYAWLELQKRETITYFTYFTSPPVQPRGVSTKSYETGFYIIPSSLASRIRTIRRWPHLRASF